MKKSRRWELRSDLHLTEEGRALIERLSRETGLSPLTVRVCVNRGLKTREAIEGFLQPGLEALKDPFTMMDMSKAVDRLVQARNQNERVRVFGDYDVDGTTGTALLSHFFRDCGYSFDAVQPDRFKDGYGLGVKGVEDAHAAGVVLLVTVDCGITSFDAITKANELGIDVIVLDHHQVDPARGIPAAHAVVNAQRPDCPSGLKELCGCGVAFYLIRALRARGRDLGWWSPQNIPNLKQHLDLVVIATAADMVPLVGDNHILVKQGMDVLKTSRKPGVRALLTEAGLSGRDISPSHLGFTIGPRINASGRMASAGVALEMLVTLDDRRAATLASQIETMNRSRMDVQNEIWDSVKDQVETGLAQGHFKNAVVVGSRDWHEGVVGIVASKVTELYHKPAIVLSIREDHVKGSVRSYGGKDVLEGLRQCAALLLGFGGHKHAAGLSFDESNFSAFVSAFDEAIGNLGVTEDPPLLTDGEASLEEFTIQALTEIEKLGPFGVGNPEPLFQVDSQVVRHSILKERHLKMVLTPSADPGRNRSFMEALWFGAAEDDAFVEKITHEAAQWLAVPEISRFRGKITPQLRVKEARFTEVSS